MPYCPDHFGAQYKRVRHDDPLFQTVDPVRPEQMPEPIPVPEATESDFAAFEALQWGQQR